MPEWEYGDRITWTYAHALNSVSRIDITKRGYFRRLVKHRGKYWAKIGRVRLACVQFDGNKGPSMVPMHELLPEATND